MRQRCLKHQEVLARILASESISDPGVSIIGFNTALIPQNISALRRLLSGENVLTISADLHISPRELSRIALRFSRLICVKAKLEDATSSVALPVVWAPNFKSASRYLKRSFCSHLELPGWAIDDQAGKRILLKDIN